MALTVFAMGTRAWHQFHTQGITDSEYYCYIDDLDTSIDDLDNFYRQLRYFYI